MGEIVRGDATDAQIAGLAVGLAVKGETPPEIAGFLRALSSDPGAVTIDVPDQAVDIVGTGGDGMDMVNVSTMAAIVTAATGATVVKHGGRAASSRCGSADLVEHLGVTLDLPVPKVERLAARVGITFCFAPVYNPGLRHAAPVRRALGVPTLFNTVAPLLNPARPRHQVVGSATTRQGRVLARVLADRGTTALVVHGDDGADELSTSTTSRVWVVRPGRIDERLVDPGALGLRAPDSAALRGGDVHGAGALVRRLLGGEPGPVRDAVLLNASAALACLDPDPEDLRGQLEYGLVRAADAIDSGAAADLLARWVRGAGAAGAAGSAAGEAVGGIAGSIPRNLRQPQAGGQSRYPGR